MFIKTVMMVSSAGSAIVCFGCFTFLVLFWSQCGVCERPLRWWILLHSVLQVAQLPVRCVFLERIHQSRQDGTSLELVVIRFTSTLAWRMSKNLSLFTYGWFVLGLVWLANAGTCAACPGVYWMTVSVMLQALSRAIIALVCFRVLFPDRDAVPVDEPKVEPAAPHEIAALPLIPFSSSEFDKPDDSCAVCLCEYEAQNLLRKLPCGHYFHQRCAEQWLWRSRRCPLCMAAIGTCAPPSAVEGG